MATTSPEAHQERQRWYDLEKEMNDFLLRRDGMCDEQIRTTRISTSILDDLSTTASEKLLNSSRSITHSLSESIRIEEDALRSESSDLAYMSANVRELESEIDTLSHSLSDAVSRRRRLIEIDIPKHKSSISEYASDIDEVRSRHVRENAKIARELCLHALLTNIKWNYGNGGDGDGGGGGGDLLMGEVSIPERAVHRRFVINRGDCECDSEYEIAERLWETIGG
jgi:hypothetical protein